ncbi:MFS general substrate transporter [Saccharata proteae CBS 121410]|uniref:MFS general substrate transporter n=1 Tax=Saccharata proteae CBS 121410 TaxID=1314787 RepID=A0A6A5YEA0_9PEZI|nr:MFS general substrate transporter [Saccharata proteae CBS 121410]
MSHPFSPRNGDSKDGKDAKATEFIELSSFAADDASRNPSDQPPQEKGTTPEQQALYNAFASNDETWHRAETKRLLRKVDTHLLPLLVLMYLLNFLDRNNLAQARLGGLEDDLGMTGDDFNLATGILFVGYLLMQLPSNLLLTRIRPSIYLGVAMTVWGAISAAQASVQSFGGLIAARFCLGFAEAPFFAGAVMMMSSWYTRKELAHRIGWFYSGSALSNAFGGLIGAGVLGGMDGSCGIEGWRWLFILEGSITIAVAIMAAFILPNYPAQTKWLTSEEREYAQWRLIEDTGEADLASASTLKDGLKIAFKDPRLYVFTLLQHTSVLSQSFQYFFPTIVKTLGFGNIQTLLISAPPWIATFLVSLLVTWSSGRTGDRSFHIISLMLITFTGNVIATATTNTAARYFAMFLMPMGAVAAYQIILAWIANSFPRPLVKRAVVIGFCNMIGNCANIYGPYMYPSSDSPRYIAGGSAMAGIAVLVAAEALVIRFILRRENKRLAEEEVLDSGGNLQNLHADRPDARAVGFRYIL